MYRTGAHSVAVSPPTSDVVGQKQEYIYLYLSDMLYMGKTFAGGNRTVELFLGNPHEIGATWKVTTVYSDEVGGLH